MGNWELDVAAEELRTGDGARVPTPLLVAGAVLVAVAALALVVPWLVLAPVVVVLIWLGVALIVDSVNGRRERARAFRRDAGSAR